MSNTLRLTVTSDCHLHDWTTFSQIGPDGRPSRLLQYRALAEDIYKQADAHGSDAILIAGDLVETSVLRPMVLDLVNEFIEYLSDFPIYLIHGNHDLDCRKSEISRYHSVLTHLKKHPNVNYADRPTLYKINGFSLLACPWGYDVDDTAAADVFMGHGAVIGSSNSEGYIFRNGFPKEDLFKRFRVSVVGDIHKGQTFEQDGRLILVPGPPLQNKHDDPEITGIWNVSLTDLEVTYGFEAIHDIRPNFYHRFVFTEESKKSPDPLTHYRVKNTKKALPKDKNKEAGVPRDANLLSVSSQIIEQAKIENKDKINEKLSLAVSKISKKERVVPNSKLKWVKTHNFLSMGDFTLDMDEFTENLVIVGQNGSGKTSILEAIYWCFTNTNTRGVPANDVMNRYSTDGTVWVQVGIEIENVLYGYFRKRSPDGPSMDIQVWDNEAGKFVEVNRITTPKTQDTIYNMLGLSASDILMFCYFSSKEAVLFGELGSTAKNNIMVSIGGTSEVEDLRSYFSTKLSDTEKYVIRLNSSIDTLSKTNEHLTGEITKLMQAQALDSQTELNNLLSSKAETEKKLSEFDQTEDQISEALTVVATKLAELGKAASDLQSEQSIMADQKNRVALSITRLNEQLRTALSGKCPTCGQTLHDEKIKGRLSNEIVDMTARLESDEDAAARADRLASIHARIDRISPAQEKLISDLRAIRDLNRRLRQIQGRIYDLQKDRPDYDALIRAHQDSMQRNNSEITVTEVSAAEARTEYNCIKWIYGTLLKRNGPLIQSLNKRTKELLQEQIDIIMEDSEFRISIDDDLSVSASFLGRDSGSYKMLSKGQERISDFVMMIAHSNLFTMIHGLDEGVLGLAAFDEVLSFLDNEYIDFAFDCLNRLKVGKRIMISHDTRLISRFDHRINVSLTGKGNSTYAKSWE